jgi:hypothetical protein
MKVMMKQILMISRLMKLFLKLTKISNYLMLLKMKKQSLNIEMKNNNTSLLIKREGKVVKLIVVIQVIVAAIPLIRRSYCKGRSRTLK